MKRILCCILFSVILASRPALAASILQDIARTDNRESTQIYLTFDNLPVYSIDVREKRLDITLEVTRPANNLKYFATDSRIIKVLPITNDDSTVISLFFRHKPRDIRTEKTSEGKLIVEIEIGNQPDRTNQLVSKQVKDMTSLDGKPEDRTNPLKNSSYAHDWQRFFTDYESELSYSVPIRYSTPPFPLIDLLPALAGDNHSPLLPSEVTELAERGSWKEIQPILLELLKATKDLEQQKRLALTLGEVLLHSDAYEDAYKQLFLLNKKYKEEPVGIFARFLLLLLQAQNLENFSASPDLKELETSLGPPNPLLPHLVLFEIETALAAQQFKKAQQLLDRQDVAYPATTQKIKDLRQADTFVGLRQPLKAYVAYQFLKDTAPFDIYQDSLKNFCETLYFHKKYKEAEGCYTRLIPLIEEKTASGLISFRKVMSTWHLAPGSPHLEDFSLVEDAFPNTEAGYRAALKKTDLKYLMDKTWAEDAIHAYHALAEKAVQRPLVAEASFKEALIYRMLGQNERSLALLMKFLRDFQSGDIRPTAQALLIDILPDTIKDLVQAKKFPEALVLAKQNKEVFLKNWLDIGILGDLAYSYRKIGLYNHAKEMYLYIMDIVKVDQREQYFLPLVETAYDQGDRKLIEQMSTRYLNTYPQGKDRDQILLFRLNALIAEGQLSQALALLPSPLPKNDMLHTVAASLAFQTNNYSNTLKYLEDISEKTKNSSPEILFMTGESLFKTGNMSGAEKAFIPLQEKKFHFDQVHYRLAQIELDKGNTEKALKLFREIVDKGESPLWRRYAAEELDYVESTDRLQRKLK
jgi:tetratricopeptide (TPR) repeat protein